jgi:hypothetical protein
MPSKSRESGAVRLPSLVGDRAFLCDCDNKKQRFSFPLIWSNRHVLEACPLRACDSGTTRRVISLIWQVVGWAPLFIRYAFVGQKKKRKKPNTRKKR